MDSVPSASESRLTSTELNRYFLVIYWVDSGDYARCVFYNLIPSPSDPFPPSTQSPGVVVAARRVSVDENKFHKSCRDNGNVGCCWFSWWRYHTGEPREAAISYASEMSALTDARMTTTIREIRENKWRRNCSPQVVFSIPRWIQQSLI